MCVLIGYYMNNKHFQLEATSNSLLKPRRAQELTNQIIAVSKELL